MCFRYAFLLPAAGKQRACRLWAATRLQHEEKREFHYETVYFSSSVPQGKRPGSRRCLRRRSAVQLRRKERRQLLRFCFRCGYQQVHRALFQPACDPELSDHRYRPGNGRGCKLRGHPGRVRQQGRNARGPGHQVGVGCRHPDLDLHPARGELGGQQRRSRCPRDRTGLCGCPAVCADPGLRFLQRGPGHRLHCRCE